MTRLVGALRGYARFLTRDTDRADDLVQETLFRAVRHIDQFQPGTNMKAWLFTILANTFRNGLRRDAVYARRLENLAADYDPPPSSSPETRALLSAVEAALLKLSLEHREVLMLIGVQQMSYEEAAAVADVAIGTIKSRLSRARIALRQVLSAASAEVAFA